LSTLFSHEHQPEPPSKLSTEGTQRNYPIHSNDSIQQANTGNTDKASYNVFHRVYSEEIRSGVYRQGNEGDNPLESLILSQNNFNQQ
jgi:hypothetical protein